MANKTLGPEVRYNGLGYHEACTIGVYHGSFPLGALYHFMSDDEDLYDDATEVANVPLQSKPGRQRAHVVKAEPLGERGRSEPLPLVRANSSGLPEDSSEVLVAPSPGPGAGLFTNENTDEEEEEYTAVEDQPLAGPPIVNLAEQASLAVAPQDDRERGFVVVSKGRDLGRQVGIPEGRTSIGRGIECDIVLTDIAVSRRHMYVERRGEVYFVCDLDSGNGTYVNGQERSGEVVVDDGDSVEIGDTIFSIKIPRVQSEEAVTQWVPPKEPGRAMAPMSLDGSFPEVETNPVPQESTIAGKGLAASESELPVYQATDSEQEPQELLTNIVGDFYEKGRQAGASPRRNPAPEHLGIEDAAFVAVDPIEKIPSAEEGEFLELKSKDFLPEHGQGPPTGDSAAPYPVPNPLQTLGPASQSPVASGPVSGHMQRASSPGLAGPIPGSFPESAQYPGGVASPPIGPQGGANPMLSGAANSSFRSHYPPARIAAPSKNRRKLIILVAAFAVLIGSTIVAALLLQGPDKNAPKVQETGNQEGQTSVDAQAKSNDDSKSNDLTGSSAETIVPESGESFVADDTSLRGALPEDPKKAKAAIADTHADMPAHSVHNEPSTTIAPTPKTNKKTKKTKKTKETRRRPRKARVPKASVVRRSPKKTSRPANVSAAKSSARALYKRRKFSEAAAILEKAANRIDNDREAMRLEDTADAYKQVGTSLAKADRMRNSRPTEALDLYKKALSRDKKFGAGTQARQIRLHLGQVAPRAAKAYMAKGNLSQAKKAADMAARYDHEGEVESVYRSLERKANSLIKKALKAKRRGDDGEAKDLLREATKIAPKNTPAYDKCRKELRKL